jgi:hypothetical protein
MQAEGSCYCKSVSLSGCNIPCLVVGTLEHCRQARKSGLGASRHGLLSSRVPYFKEAVCTH